MRKLNAALTGFLVAIATLAAATTIVSIQQQQQGLAYALEPVPCEACAKEFAPGQEKKVVSDDDDNDFETTSAKEYAPGQKAKIIGPEQPDQGASEFAPGQVKIPAPCGQCEGDFGN